MRKLWPFVGIALAVAVGIALAPFVWWLVVLGGLAALGWWQRRYWPVVVLAAVYAWPVWLASRQQYADAAFAAVLVTLVCFWRILAAWVRPAWLTVFPD